MLRLVEARDGLARHPGEHPVQRLEQHDLAAELAQHRGRLEADIAAADHRDPLHLGELGAQPVGVGAAADRVHALETVAGEAFRRAARRPDENAVAEPCAVSERHDLRIRVDRDHRAAEQQFDLPLRPEGDGTDQQPLEVPLAGQIVLGQRRALIGRVRLGADDRE